MEQKKRYPMSKIGRRIYFNENQGSWCLRKKCCLKLIEDIYAREKYIKEKKYKCVKCGVYHYKWIDTGGYPRISEEYFRCFLVSEYMNSEQKNVQRYT